MNKALVRCRCGHQVLAREVLRTDLYERSMGREYVYVKFRCKRCKRMGEAFVAESRWDWSILEPAPGEMSSEERDRFLDMEEISETEVEAFHRQLENLSSLAELNDTTEAAAPGENQEEVTAEAGEARPECGPASNAAPGTAAPNAAAPNTAAPNAASQNVASNVASNAPAKGKTSGSRSKRPPSGDDKRPRS